MNTSTNFRIRNAATIVDPPAASRISPSRIESKELRTKGMRVVSLNRSASTRPTRPAGQGHNLRSTLSGLTAALRRSVASTGGIARWYSTVPPVHSHRGKPGRVQRRLSTHPNYRIARRGLAPPEKELRPAVTVYNSPVLPSEPSSRCPAQPLRAEPSSPTEPVALRQPTPQPFRAGPPDLTIREWGPCGSLVGDLQESFPSLAGFLTGRRGNVNRWSNKPQYGTFVHKQPLVFPFMLPRLPLA